MSFRQSPRATTSRCSSSRCSAWPRARCAGRAERRGGVACAFRLGWHLLLPACAPGPPAAALGAALGTPQGGRAVQLRLLSPNVPACTMPFNGGADSGSIIATAGRFCAGQQSSCACACAHSSLRAAAPVSARPMFADVYPAVPSPSRFFSRFPA